MTGTLRNRSDVWRDVETRAEYAVVFIHWRDAEDDSGEYYRYTAGSWEWPVHFRTQAAAMALTVEYAADNPDYERRIVRLDTLREADGRLCPVGPAKALTRRESELLGDLSGELFDKRVWCDVGRELVAGRLLLVERL